MKKYFFIPIMLLLCSISYSQEFIQTECNNFFEAFWASCDWGDMDNDGDLDVLVSGARGELIPTTEVYRNEGNDNFARMDSCEFTGLYHSQSGAKWCDYNMDGFADFIIAGEDSNSTSRTILYKNINGKTFEAQPEIFAASSKGVISWPDIDQDGDPDLCISGMDTNYLHVTNLYENNGDGTFTIIENHGLPGVVESAFAWGDYNNDGYVDVFIVGIEYSNEYLGELYANNWNNTFSPVLIHPTPFSGFRDGRAAWADYDKDGDLDLAYGGSPGSGYGGNYLYRNEDNNYFILQNTDFPAINRGSMIWSDLNNDTYPDLIISGSTGWKINETFICINNGDGSFSEPLEHNMPGFSIGEIRAGDYDNDGDTDLLGSGLTYQDPEHMTAVFKNVLIDTITNRPYTVHQNMLKLIPNFTATGYQWLKGTDYEIIEGANDMTYMPVAPGYYSVELSFGSCRDTSEFYYFVWPNGVKKYNTNNINLYPNPCNDILTIDAHNMEGNITIYIFNNFGENVIQFEETGGNDIFIDLKSLPNGLYQINSTDGMNLWSGKIIKTN